MKTLIPILTAFILFAACDDILLPEQPDDNPVGNFELLWDDFDKLYGGFEVKNLDWDGLYAQYRSLIHDQSTDHDLYEALTGMLKHLNDNHVFLFPTNPTLEPFVSGVLGDLVTFDDFKLSVVQDHYVPDWKEPEESIQHGWINDEIAYVHFSNFNEGAGIYKTQMEKLVKKYQDAEGMIIDVRNNEGGYDQASVLVAGYFATEKVDAFRFRLRNGPDHDDFTDWRNYSVEPEGDQQFTKNVVVLTHRFTISAAETFVLSMDRFDHVTVVGDTTSGAFSDVIRRELPNGWAYGVAVGDWRAHDGTSYEGIGFPPDVIVENNPEDLAEGRDEALEQALELFR